MDSILRSKFWQYTYDYENRLTRAADRKTTTRYQYDAVGSNQILASGSSGCPLVRTCCRISMLCSIESSTEVAYAESSAVFLGELVEIKPVIIDTTHHGKKEYFTGKFRVVSSWKSIDKEWVSVDLPGKRSDCVEFAEGTNYLVFANRSGDDLYIATDSRTSPSNTEIAVNDLGQLGETKLIVTSGEFTLRKGPAGDIAIAILIFAVLCCGLYFWLRKRMAMDLSKFTIAVSFLIIFVS